MAATGEIPDKIYFRIGEAARLVGVKPYVLRFWEKEFPFIQPEKHSGQRLYRKHEIELFREIRRLLHDERYTIEGTRKKLIRLQRSQVTPEISADACLLKMKNELLDLRKVLHRRIQE